MSETGKKLWEGGKAVVGFLWDWKKTTAATAAVTAVTVDQVANDGRGTRAAFGAAGRVGGAVVDTAAKAAKDAGSGFFSALSESLGGFGMMGALIGGGIGLLTGGFSFTGILLAVGLAVGGYALASSFSGDKGGRPASSDVVAPTTPTGNRQSQPSQTPVVEVGAPPPRVNAPNPQVTARQP